MIKSKKIHQLAITGIVTFIGGLSMSTSAAQAASVYGYALGNIQGLRVSSGITQINAPDSQGQSSAIIFGLTGESFTSNSDAVLSYSGEGSRPAENSFSPMGQTPGVDYTQGDHLFVGGENNPFGVNGISANTLAEGYLHGGLGSPTSGSSAGRWTVVADVQVTDSTPTFTLDSYSNTSILDISPDTSLGGSVTANTFVSISLVNSLDSSIFYTLTPGELTLSASANSPTIPPQNIGGSGGPLTLAFSGVQTGEYQLQIRGQANNNVTINQDAIPAIPAVPEADSILSLAGLAGLTMIVKRKKVVSTNSTFKA